jgi:carbamoyl-phosphate synthase large subunit
VCGVMNIQYAICHDKVYVLEANPRASRTVPLVSKICNVPMARLATQLMLGTGLHELGLKHRSIPHSGVKEVVLPFNMFPEVDPVLGPEMRSTGEVLGLAPSFGLAYFKAQEAAQPALPLSGTVFISVADKDKPGIVNVARQFLEQGFLVTATNGTRAHLQAAGLQVELSHKVHELQRPNIVDQIKSREIQLIINTPIGKTSQFDDGYIRKTAIKYKVPYITTVAAARASALGIAAVRAGPAPVKSLQAYHQDIR